MASDLRREIHVVGVGMTPFGRHEGKTTVDLGGEAIRTALSDSGLDYSDVEIAYCGHVMQGSTAGQKVLYSVGTTGIPIFESNARMSPPSRTRGSIASVTRAIAPGGSTTTSARPVTLTSDVPA